jgi:hypothetical protein
MVVCLCIVNYDNECPMYGYVPNYKLIKLKISRVKQVELYNLCSVYLFNELNF